MADSEPRERTWAGRLVALTPLFTAALAVWNVSIQQRLNQAETTLRERAQQLEAQRDRVARLTFVHERLFPDLLGADPRRRGVTVQLIRLTIPEDADSLFAGLRASADSGLREVGATGAAAAAGERAAQLVAQLIGPDKATRTRAFDELRARHAGSTAAITYALDALSPPRLARLSADGRVNALLFLAATAPEAWSPEQVQRAPGVLAAVEATVTPQTGRLTLERAGQVRAVIRRAQEGG
jgi:hypothetical protein